MKKTVLLFSAALLSIGAFAQNSYDAVNIASSDLNGTARYVGMGGALSALGGDISVMGTNPAGTAMFRKCDAAFTIGGVFTDKDVLGNDRSRASLDNAGLVVTLPSDDSNLKYINFGINYAKKKNFLSNLYTEIDGIQGLSQTAQIANMANMSIGYGDEWMGALPYVATNLENNYGELNSLCNYDNVSGFYYDAPAKYADFYKSQRGSSSQTDINLSFNVLDKYFFGASIGLYNMNYSRETSYFEADAAGVATYQIDNYYDSKGDGFDVKLGFICRPMDDSPFRFGLSVHTPIWYQMEDCHGMSISMYNGDYFTGSDIGFEQYPYCEYRIRTPWKFGASLGYTVDNYFAIGAEYEFQNMKDCHFSADEYDFANKYYSTQNKFIKNNLKAQSTLKLGMEVKPTQSFSLRAGYNFVSSPFKQNAFNSIYYNDDLTETDFINWKDTHRFTFGLGYRYKGGYIDLAYQYQAQKGNLFAFDTESLKPTAVENNRSQLLCTFGFRF